MKRTSEEIVKTIVFGTFVLTIGMFVGFTLNSNGVSIKKLQGSISNINNKAPSSTTVSEVSINEKNTRTDGVINISTFSFNNSSSLKKGDKLNIKLETTGAYISGGSITMINDIGDSFTETINSINSSPYIIIPSNINNGTYHLKEILLIGTNKDNSTFVKVYNSTSFDFSSNNINIE